MRPTPEQAHQMIAMGDMATENTNSRLQNLKTVKIINKKVTAVNTILGNLRTNSRSTTATWREMMAQHQGLYQQQITKKQQVAQAGKMLQVQHQTILKAEAMTDKLNQTVVEVNQMVVDHGQALQKLYQADQKTTNELFDGLTHQIDTMNETLNKRDDHQIDLDRLLAINESFDQIKASTIALQDTVIDNEKIRQQRFVDLNVAIESLTNLTKAIASFLATIQKMLTGVQQSLQDTLRLLLQYDRQTPEETDDILNVFTQMADQHEYLTEQETINAKRAMVTDEMITQKVTTSDAYPIKTAGQDDDSVVSNADDASTVEVEPANGDIFSDGSLVENTTERPVDNDQKASDHRIDDADSELNSSETSSAVAEADSESSVDSSSSSSASSEVVSSSADEKSMGSVDPVSIGDHLKETNERPKGNFWKHLFK